MSRKILIGVACLILFAATASAQPDTLWTRLYYQADEEYPCVLLAAPDGGFYMAGRIESSADGHCDPFVRKVNSQGNELWCRYYDRENRFEYIYGGCMTRNGDLVLVGNPGNVLGSAWILRLNADGDTLWTRVFRGFLPLTMGALAVTEMPDSGLLVTSDYYLITAWSGCAWTKFSARGDSLWTRSYESPFSGADEVYLYDIEPLADGGYLIAGNELSLPGLDKGFLIRLNQNGDSLWTRLFIWPNRAMGFRSVCESTDGSFFLTGTLDPLGSSRDFLAKVTSQGDSLWMRELGNDFILAGWLRGDVRPTADGGAVVFNEVQRIGFYEPLVQKVDGDGHDEWVWEGNLTRSFTDWKGAAGLILPDGGLLALGAVARPPRPYTVLSGLIRFTPDTTAEVTGHHTAIPQNPDLSVFPNPFNPTTEIRFDLARGSHVQVKIYNSLGQWVTTLADDARPAGTYTLTWDGKTASGIPAVSGTYICQLKAGKFVDAKKLMLIR